MVPHDGGAVTEVRYDRLGSVDELIQLLAAGVWRVCMVVKRLDWRNQCERKEA
jgi:hypothetical protein